MIDKLNENLGANGIMLISYLYQTISTAKYQSNWKPIYSLEKKLKILEQYNPEFISFTGIKFEDEPIKDSILVYRKK